MGNSSPYRVKGWRGWRCHSGAGGGRCDRGKRRVAWQVRVADPALEGVTVLGEKDNGLFADIGVPQPSVFFSLAGNETFLELTWTDWGARAATATGWFSPASGPNRRVRLVASGLDFYEDCDLAKTYRRLTITLEGEKPLRRVLCH